eukprot:4262212-Prymnesium_polylepis.1
MLDLQAVAFDASDATDDEDVDTWLPAILDLQARILDAVQSMQGAVSPAEAETMLARIEEWPTEAELDSMSSQEVRTVWEDRFDQDRAVQRRLHSLHRGGAAVGAPELPMSQFTPTQQAATTPLNRSRSRPYSMGGTATAGY